MNKNIISYKSLYNLFASIDRPIPIGFSALTKINALKKDRISKKRNPYSEIYKFNSYAPFIFTNYSKAVNAQRKRERVAGKFISQVPNYQYLKGALVKYSTGTTCAAVQFNRENQKSRPIYLVSAGRQLRIVSVNKVKGFLPRVALPRNQRLRRPVVWRTFGLKSILSVNINGKRLIIKRTGLLKKMPVRIK